MGLLDKIKYKKLDNLIYEKNFKEIEIVDEFDVNTLKKIQKQCTVRRKNLEGDFEEHFDITEYNVVKILNCCKFDGKAITREEVNRFESGFYNDLVKLLSRKVEISEE